MEINDKFMEIWKVFLTSEEAKNQPEKVRIVKILKERTW